MITVTAQEICRACSGDLLAGSEDTSIGAISTDTRDDLQGKLFIALKGEHFDGNDFAEEALADGAIGIIAETGAAARAAAGLEGSGDGSPLIIAVDDTGDALKKIASLVASKSSATVVAVTGSTGKTSTKDILSALLAPQVAAVSNRASFNNEVGVPLTLLEVGPDTGVVVVEMGMQAPGEIGELCRIVAPDIAIITNVGPAHLEYAGSLENIAAGKAEIAHGLKTGGRLVAPHGEELLKPHIGGLDIEVVTFGMSPDADIHPRYHEHLEDGRLRSVISCLGETVEADFNFSAHHHLLNAMAAMGAYRLLGLPLTAVPEAATGIHLSNLRGEQLLLECGATLINDCYNANPLSVSSALEYLASVGTGRRTVAVLGDMGELGPDALSYHRQVGRVAGELGIDCLVAVGELARGFIEGAAGTGERIETHYFASRAEAIAAVPGMVGRDDILLVKASRFMRLEQLSEAIIAAGKSDGPGEV